jgi:serine/threonine-protein kinase
METFELTKTLRKQRCLLCHREFEWSDDLRACPDDGSMLSPVFDDPLIGSTIDNKYEILDRIASGAKSRIYKARHQHLDRYVAVKVLQGGEVVTRVRLGRFQKEAQVAVGLSHPNIVRVYDYGTHPQPYIAMEYVEGKTLAQIIEKEGPLPIARALHLFVQICEAMATAHAAGLVHRDLKPSNIMIEIKSNDAKVLDFGLVKDFVDDGEYTRTGETVGSPAYMSPEQCKGEALDARSDIYSLGCLMFEALTGKCAFAGDNTVECMFKHLEGTAPPLKQVRRGVKFPQGLQTVIDNCLAKEPKDRYQSMADLKNDLVLVQTGKGKRLTAITRRKKPASLAGLGLVVSVVVLGVVAMLGFQELTRPEWQKTLNRGVGQINNGVYTEETEKLFIQAKEKAEAAHFYGPDLEDIYGYAGQAELDLGHYNQAKADLERALEWNMKHGEGVPTSHWNIKLSDTYLRLGDTKRAIEYAQKGLVIARRQSGKPSRLCEDWYTLGLAFYQQGDYKDAVQPLEQARKIYLAAKLKWNDWPIEFAGLLGDIYFHLNREQDSLDAYGDCLKLAWKENPKDMDTYVGELASHLRNRPDASVIDGIAARHQWPSDLTAFTKGAVLAEQGSLDEAAPLLDQVAKDNPQCLVALLWQAHNAQWRREFPEAISEYRHIKQLAPDWTDASIGLAQCLTATGLYDEALSELNQVMGSHSDDDEAYWMQAWIHFAAGQYELSANSFARHLPAMNWHSDYCPEAVILANLANRFNHNSAAANDVVVKFEQESTDDDWPRPVIEYLRGKITAKLLLQAAGDDPLYLTEAHVYLGFDCFARNQVRQGKEYLDWVIEQGDDALPAYDLAVSFLARGNK